jgi:spore coat protein U-like protein
MNTTRNSLKLSLIAALSTLCALDAGVAQAGSSNTSLGVSAAVTDNCTISTAPVAFGSYDPASANATTALDSTGTVTVTCTSGAAATITLDPGATPAAASTDIVPLRQMSDGGANLLAYKLYQNSGRTTVWGNTSGTGVGHTGIGSSANLTVYGRVAAGQNVPSGTYTDTVTATVSF